MGYESIKRDFAKFVSTNIPNVGTRIYTTYPSLIRFTAPSIVIDITSSYIDRTIKSSSTHKMKFNGLISLVIITDDVKELDQITDLFISAFITKPTSFTSCKVFGVSSISPTIQAFEEKDNIFRRNINIKVKEII